MGRDFENDDYEPAQRSRDTELTLGPWVLIGLSAGLLLLCGLSFGAGYRMGRGNTPTVATAQTAAAASPAVASNAGHAKPSAAPTSTSKASASQPDTSLPSAEPTTEAAGPATTYTPYTPPAATVHPALPMQPPAASQAPMVQIAAVSHREDAEVLVSALRKRGYAVSVRQDADDSLLHVRIGPFNSRDEAARWRQKLLNDGYNAIMQP